MTALHHALSSLPKTLDETYSRILNNVGEEDRPAVRRIFQWLCFSRRPLFVEEIGTVYHLAEPFEFPFNTEQDLFQPDGILDTCRGLFILKDIPGGLVESRCHYDLSVIYETIQLAHFSVKEYLISARSLYWKLDELQSHLSIIKASTAYFMYVAASEDAKVLTVIDLIKAYPLADYAAEYSSKHLDVLSPREHPDLLETFQRLFDPGSWSQCLLNNLHMIYATEMYYMRRDHSSECTSYSELPTRGFASWSLTSVSRLGLVETMKWLLSFEDVRSEINTYFNVHNIGPPIAQASASGHAEIVLTLLNASADPNFGPCPALHRASMNGHAQIVRVLIDAGAHVDRKDRWDYTALFRAANTGNVEAIQILLEAGADLDHGGRHGRASALREASGGPLANAAALQLLLHRGSTAYRRSVYRSALRAATGKCNDETIHILLDAGKAEGDSKEQRDGYAIQAASLNGDKETLQHFIDSGGDVNMTQGGYFSCALYAATLCGRADIVQMLLNAGADPNWRKGSESPVLQIAAAKGYTEIVSMLLAAGADVDEERGRFHGCALQVASLRGLKEIVHILVQGGADVNHFGGLYGSSLQAACTGGDTEDTSFSSRHWQDHTGTVQLLLAAGADVNQQGGKYGSALGAAMAWTEKKQKVYTREGTLAWQYVDIANLLLEAGVTLIDERDVPSPVSEWWVYNNNDESEYYDSDGESDANDTPTDSYEL
jgi:ankyrin repeat protein